MNPVSPIARPDVPGRTASANGTRASIAAPARRPTAQALRRLSHEFEAVFLSQLFQSMRASVPESGLLERTEGEDMFRGLLDDRLAREAAKRMERGLGEQLYRQLSRRLGPDSTGAPR